MTDECRPAAGAENHWFKHKDHGYRLYERISGTALGTFWMYRDFGGKSETLAAEGWTYHLPASPDDATERARLEREVQDLRNQVYALKRSNARMREALAFYANPETYPPPPHGAASDQRSSVARTALAALTPGATP